MAIPERSRRVSKHGETKITGRIRKERRTMTMKEGGEGGREGGRRRHKKLRGNKFIQPFFPPRPSVWPVFWCKASSESRGETGERCPEIGRKTPNCSFSFLPLQRSKLREALEATHHKSSSSSSTSSAAARRWRRRLKAV